MLKEALKTDLAGYISEGERLSPKRKIFPTEALMNQSFIFLILNELSLDMGAAVKSVPKD